MFLQNYQTQNKIQIFQKRRHLHREEKIAIARKTKKKNSNDGDSRNAAGNMKLQANPAALRNSSLLPASNRLQPREAASPARLCPQSQRDRPRNREQHRFPTPKPKPRTPDRSGQAKTTHTWNRWSPSGRRRTGSGEARRRASLSPRSRHEPKQPGRGLQQAAGPCLCPVEVELFHPLPVIPSSLRGFLPCSRPARRIRVRVWRGRVSVKPLLATHCALVGCGGRAEGCWGVGSGEGDYLARRAEEKGF
jgi:hypothetical protein